MPGARQGEIHGVINAHLSLLSKRITQCVFQMLRLQNTAMGTDTGEAMAEMWNEGKVG